MGVGILNPEVNWQCHLLASSTDATNSNRVGLFNVDGVERHLKKSEKSQTEITQGQLLVGKKLIDTAIYSLLSSANNLNFRNTNTLK